MSVTLIGGLARELLLGRAARFEIGDVVYMPLGDRWMRAHVQGVKKDHVCVWGRWWPADDVRRKPPEEPW